MVIVGDSGRLKLPVCRDLKHFAELFSGVPGVLLRGYKYLRAILNHMCTVFSAPCSFGTRDYFAVDCNTADTAFPKSAGAVRRLWTGNCRVSALFRWPSAFSHSLYLFIAMVYRKRDLCYATNALRITYLNSVFSNMGVPTCPSSAPEGYPAEPCVLPARWCSTSGPYFHAQYLHTPRFELLVFLC